MDGRDTEMMAKIIGENAGQVAVAVLELVDALKNQPGFDRAAFDADIRERIAARESDSENSLVKSILTQSLGDDAAS